MTRKSLFYTLFVALILVGCDYDPLNVDASDQKVNLEFINLDSTFIHADSASFVTLHNSWKENMSDIYNYELGHCLQLPELSGPETFTRISTFRQDPYIVELEKEIADRFNQERLGVIKKEITDGFKHLKYHFPKEISAERVIFMNSLFASNVFCTEKEIGIGLERYLGAESKSIKALPEREFYGWIKEAMDDKFLVRDVFAGWISTNYMDEPEGSLIEQMIHWGKVIYLTEAALPNAKKHIIMRYESEDLEWAKKNEFAFWEYLVNEKLLFKTEELNIINMLKEGPFTPGLPEKGPDRLGQYLGWQMVKQYVEKERITLDKLLSVSYNDILQNYEIE